MIFPSAALDWTIFLADVAKELTLVHRGSSFRGAPESADKVAALAAEGKINLVLNSNVVEVHGQNRLEAVIVQPDKADSHAIAVDYFIPLFGLVPKLGPIDQWGLELDKGAIVVNTFDYSTNIPGVYAIGDINTYPGKLKLILCGFHESALAAQGAYKLVYPDKKYSLKYTTVNGIQEL